MIIKSQHNHHGYVWVRWRWPEGGDATNSWALQGTFSPIWLQCFFTEAVSLLWKGTAYHSIMGFLSFCLWATNSWQSQWLLSGNTLFSVARTASCTCIGFFSFVFCCYDADRFSNLAPRLSADPPCYKPKFSYWSGEGRPDLGADYFSFSGTSLLPASKCHSVCAQQLSRRRSVPSGGCCSPPCSWQRKWHLFSVPAVSSTEVPKPKCLSSWSRSEEGFLMPDHGLDCRQRESRIVSFNDGGLGGMEREWQRGRERTSNRSRGKDERRVRNKTGMAKRERRV